jgi:hypothetical protein
MPKKPTEPTARPDAAPATNRTRPLREQLHEAVNANITRTVTEGLKGVDDMTARGKAELKRRGIEGMDEIADTAGDLFKRLLVRGISK